MRIEPNDAIALRAVIRHDLEVLERLSAALDALPEGENRDRTQHRTQPPDERDVIAAGYWLHGIYNTLENTFEQISRTFENHVKDTAHWHRELLDKMFLDMSPLRPAVLPTSCRNALHEMRGFRHVFRHAYDPGLEGARVREVRERWLSIRQPTLAALRAFAALLDQAAS